MYKPNSNVPVIQIIVVIIVKFEHFAYNIEKRTELTISDFVTVFVCARNTISLNKTKNILYQNFLFTNILGEKKINFVWLSDRLLP